MRDIKPTGKKSKPLWIEDGEAPKTVPKRLPGRSVPMVNITPEQSTQPQRHSLPMTPKPPSSSRATAPQMGLPRLGARERSIVIVLLVVALITAGLAAWVFLPSADVKLVLRTAPLLVDEEVTVRANADNIVSVVPGTSFFRETEVSGTAPVASTEVIGAKAAGTVRLINRTLDEQQIKAQSRLVTDNGTLFYMQEAAIIPAASTGAVASFDVLIEAAEAGEQGNVADGRLNFAALDASSRTLVYAEVLKPISGGAGELVSVIKENDLASARQAAGDQARGTVAGGIAEELPSGWTLLEESWEMTLLSFETDVAEDDRVTEIPYRARVSARVIGYEEAALEKVLKSALESRLEDDFMLFPGAITFTKQVREVDWESGEATIAARVTHTTIADLSLDTLRAKLQGRSPKDAEEYLNGLRGVQSVSIETWPFWATNIPRIQNRISLDLQPERQP